MKTQTMPQRINIQTTSGPREIQTRWRGAFLAVHAPHGGETIRGLWTITYQPAGMRAASVAASLKAAVALAKAWDSRFASLDPQNAQGWPEREAWAQAIRETETPAIAARLARQETQSWLNREFGETQETAAVLAAQIGRPIDQHGGTKRMQWRGVWWPLPSDSELQEWTIDSVCETPDGRSVEPDHPESWLSLLGLV